MSTKGFDPHPLSCIACAQHAYQLLFITLCSCQGRLAAADDVVYDGIQRLHGLPELQVVGGGQPAAEQHENCRRSVTQCWAMGGLRQARTMADEAGDQCPMQLHGHRLTCAHLGRFTPFGDDKAGG